MSIPTYRHEPIIFRKEGQYSVQTQSSVLELRNSEDAKLEDYFKPTVLVERYQTKIGGKSREIL